MTKNLTAMSHSSPSMSTYEPLLSSTEGFDDHHEKTHEERALGERAPIYWPRVLLIASVVLSLLANGLQFWSSLSMQVWRGDKLLYSKSCLVIWVECPRAWI